MFQLLSDTWQAPPVQPRWYQAEAIQSIFDYFAAGNRGNPVIALPTGSGKTHVIAGFMKRVMQAWPTQRFIICTHVKELVEQNARKLAVEWPTAPYGINSAGLKRRDTQQPIIIGGIQSMYKLAQEIGWRDIMIVDEAHLVSPDDDTMYQEFIKALQRINPRMKVIGLSATIFRQKQGLITDSIEGGIFTDVCYNLCTIDGFNRLIDEGYLSRIYPKHTSFRIDVSDVKLNSGGDFVQSQLDGKLTEKIMFDALKEALHYGQNRRSWLAFVSGIEKTELAVQMLNYLGVSATAVHSKLKDPKDRDRRIAAHKSGEVRCMVGNNIFTTGYDHPPLDFLIDLQPTMSVAKHVQKYGRVMRPSPETGKENALILDFAGNTIRCGPINDPYIPKRSNKGGGDAPVRICDVCGTYNHAAARVCEGCGEEFEFRVKITHDASAAEIIKTVHTVPVIEIYDVHEVMYFKHISKKTGVPCLKVIYRCGGEFFTEWVYIEGKTKALHDAHNWWRQRHAVEPPQTVNDALKFISELRAPRKIKVWVNQKFPTVTGVEW